MVKSGPATLVVLLVVAEVVAEADTWIVKSTLWLNAPLVPVTLSVNDPVEEVGSAVTDNGDVAVLPEGGVMGDVSAKLTPDGAVPTQEPPKSTGDVNAFSEATVIVAEPPPP